MESSEKLDVASFLQGVNPEIEHLVRDALQSQGDLREYSKSVEKELVEVHSFKNQSQFPIPIL